MIDGRYKAEIDRYWDVIARRLAQTGLTPNQITWTGLALILASSGLYLWHKDNLWFGVSLAVAFSFDALDGAVARITERTSRYGGYLDAVVDRYQEVVVFLAIAWVNDYWLVAFLAMTGALLTSYNKARTAIEIPVDNVAWPDLLERLERIILVCAALMLDPVVNAWIELPEAFLFYALVLLAALSHATAVQRFFRARGMLRSEPDTDS
ncbi:MAG: CDP-alcohol phosphatidyltransferase family protein [Alphaproteobacteria bacterium]|jgi:CDP-diacylglycerol--glycerol-3-phosphate 3-phosphatidyltransferase/archaetidylinositol phosphate synthase|nr:CDP-alcohol phosphatidyltransferase family protein [Alphaproteobacteria bacterium]